MSEKPSIRPLEPHDDLERLTLLIRAAYAAHGGKGLRFWGTHQPVEDTAKRFASGYGFVAEMAGEYVGTITVRPPQPQSPALLYRDPYTWSIAQFAVAPSLKGVGLGRALHEAALAYAEAQGGRVMALDTAAPAEGLIEMYRRWGYEVVGEVDWRPNTNYLSVLMARPIRLGAL